MRLVSPLFQLLLFASASAQPLPWRGEETCDGAGCCRSGSSKPGKTCVEAGAYELPTPDGKSYEKFHYVRRYSKSGVYEWGMADADGDVFADVAPGKAVALDSRTLLRCDVDCELLRKGAKPVKLGPIAEATLEDGNKVRLFFVSDKVRGGFAPLRPDCTLGPTIWGMSSSDPIGFDKTAAFRVQESTEAPPTAVLVDAAGNIVNVVPELRSYLIPNSSIDDGNDGKLRRAALLVVGVSPAPFGAPDKLLYHPADPETGLPLKLPPGVIGFQAARLGEPPILGGYYKTEARVARIWVGLEKTDKGFRFRMDGGDGKHPGTLVRGYSSLESLDTLEYSRLGPDGRPGTGSFLVGRLAGGTGWLAFNGYDRGHGATLELAAIAMHGEAERRRQQDRQKWEDYRKAQKEREKYWSEQAQLKEAAWAARLKEWAQPYEARLKRGDECGEWSECRQWERAALYVGEPYATDWFRSHQIYGGQESVEFACKHQGTLCDLAKERYEQNVEEGRRESRRRAQAEARQNAYLKGMVEAASRMPDVTVGYYEGGRLQYKKMSWDAYQGVYGR